MCRRNQMNGVALAALGIGIMIGRWISSPFAAFVSGCVLIVLGVCILRQQ